MILFFMLFKTFSNMLEFSREVRNPSDCFFIKSVTTEDIFKNILPSDASKVT